MITAALFRGQEDADDLARLSPVSEQLATAFQRILASAKVEVKAGPVAAARYAEWRIAQNPCAMLLRYTFGANGDEIVFHIPGYFVSQAMDIGYGGQGQVAARSSLTATETRFVERIAEQLLSYVSLAVAKPCQLAEIQSDILAFAWPKSRDQIVLASFFVENPAIKSATIGCFMDEAVARRLRDRLAEPGEVVASPNPEWRMRMKSAAMRVNMTARAVLTGAELPASQLLTLKPGDILPVLLPSQIPLTVAGRRFACGTIGEANGRAALKIEQIERMIYE